MLHGLNPGAVDDGVAMFQATGKANSLLCSCIALLLLLESAYSFGLGLLAVLTHTQASIEGATLERDLLLRVGYLGLFGGILLTLAVGVAFPSLGLRRGLRGAAPLVLGFGIIEFVRPVELLLGFSGLPENRWGWAATSSALGFVSIGLLGFFVGPQSSNPGADASGERGACG